MTCSCANALAGPSNLLHGNPRYMTMEEIVDKDKKAPEQIADQDLDAAQGGYSVPLTNGTVGSLRTEQLSRDGLADYDESGPGIVHQTASNVVDTGIDLDHSAFRHEHTRLK